MPEVCAVVVTYNPDHGTLAQLLQAVRPQVAHVVVVDNASRDEQALTTVVTRAGAYWLRRPTNEGLAAAQNVGIDEARRRAASHVLLFDQDSVPAPDMVTNLLAAHSEVAARRPAAVGPVFRDPREHRDAPFVRVGFPMSRKLWCRGAGPIECDFLISSGSLIPMPVLDDVGPMNGDLFIDNVDLEWSFRVRSRGYRLFGVCGASMEHSLGDRRVPTLGGRLAVVAHSPVRLYFIMRNRLTLYRLPHTPRVWIAQDLPRVLAKFLIFSVLVGPRRRNVRYMVRGLQDGLRGRLGPCPLERA